MLDLNSTRLVALISIGRSNFKILKDSVVNIPNDGKIYACKAFDICSKTQI
jgi:hypothetical protein